MQNVQNLLCFPDKSTFSRSPKKVLAKKRGKEGKKYFLG